MAGDWVVGMGEGRVGGGEFVCDGDGDDDVNQNSVCVCVYERSRVCLNLCIQHQINESAQTLLKSQKVFFPFAFEKTYRKCDREEGREGVMLCVKTSDLHSMVLLVAVVMVVVVVVIDF